MEERNNDKPVGQPALPEATNLVHPRVYVLMVGLAGWLVMSIWSFSGVGSTDYLLTIVSGFIFVAVALPFILSRLLRGGGKQPSFGTWRSRDFDTWTGRLRGSQAAIEILLPIAAVAFGMTAFGIVLHFVERTST